MIKLRLRALHDKNERDGYTKDVLWPTVPGVGDVLEIDPETMGIAVVLEVWHFPFCSSESYLIEVKFAVDGKLLDRLEELGWDNP